MERKRIVVDATGIEPATPCLQSKRKFNLSRCFGCAYQFQALLKLLQRCPKPEQEHAKNLSATAEVFDATAAAATADRGVRAARNRVAVYSIPR
jgi:hypothetical protein